MDMIAMIAGYAALSLACIGLLCIALSPKPHMVEDDQYTPERPFPGPVIIQLAVGDREVGRSRHDKDFESNRFEWAARMEAEELIRDVEESA